MTASSPTVLLAALYVAPFAAAAVLAFLPRRIIDTVALYLIATATTVGAVTLLPLWQHGVTDGCNDGGAYSYINTAPALIAGLTAMVVWASARAADTTTARNRIALTVAAVAIIAAPLVVSAVTGASELGPRTMRGCYGAEEGNWQPSGR